MDITKYWARLVSAGLDLNWKNIFAVWTYSSIKIYCSYKQSNEKILSINTISSNIEEFDDPIQLRKDGIDLYSLEWRKPTEKDIGKMCWFTTVEPNINIIQFHVLKADHLRDDLRNYIRILVADHGNICPSPEDFKQVYGE